MDASSRGMLVELQADNADGKLLAGAYCQVHFKLPGDPNTVRVPATALLPVDQGVQVAVLGAANKATFKTVRPCRDFGDSVEGTSGLAPTDREIDNQPETLRSADGLQ